MYMSSEGRYIYLGERTDTLENKFDEPTQYVHVLEEDNAAMKHTVAQLQQKNRERRQNLRICGVPEPVSDEELRPSQTLIGTLTDPWLPSLKYPTAGGSPFVYLPLKMVSSSR